MTIDEIQQIIVHLAEVMENGKLKKGEIVAKETKLHRRPRIGTPHKPNRSPRQEGKRESAAKRGYGRKWTKFRDAFIERNPICEYCLAKGHVTPSEICDHDLPHEHDPVLFWDNTFTALCKHCHDSTKQRLERRYKGDALLQAIKPCKGVD